MINCRIVNEHGETLVVGIARGVKALVDPCDVNIVVYVSPGRRASLVQFSLGLRSDGRDTSTTVFQSEAGLGFRTLGSPTFDIMLRDLPVGQQVDIPDNTHIHARLRRPLPVMADAIAARFNHVAIAA